MRIDPTDPPGVVALSAKDAVAPAFRDFDTPFVWEAP